jgi:hypothetical protein
MAPCTLVPYYFSWLEKGRAKSLTTMIASTVFAIVNDIPITGGFP